MVTHQFPFQHELLDRICADWVARDARSATLSPAFRLYYSLRYFIPPAARRAVQRARPVPAGDQWYVLEAFLNHLADVINTVGTAMPVVYPWPDGAKFALVLTHDVETAAGMANIGRIAQIEKSLGIRSSWNFVPRKYVIDAGMLRDLRERGFEIGVHGYNHDGKLFLSARTFRKRAPLINQALRQFDAVGFRAPMVHRNLNWMQDLAIDYDSSCFDVDPYQAMPGGVGSIWPFIASRFVELPYTVPQDHTLLVARNERLLPTWRIKADMLARCGGMILTLTHPDYLTSARDLDDYATFLEWVQTLPGCWHALPREVATWWRRRQASQLKVDESGQISIVGPAAKRGRVGYLVVRDRLPTISDAPDALGGPRAEGVVRRNGE